MLMKKTARGRYRAADKSEVLAAAAEYMVAEVRGSYLTNPDATKAFLRVALGGRDSEAFAVVWLTSQHSVIGFDVLFTGTVDRSAVYPREVLKLFLARNAVGCIFAHNHPSGKLEPSQADEWITRRLKEALALVDGRVLDHFIVTREGMYSFSEHGLI